MAKDRETPCLYYICMGECRKVEMQIIGIIVRSATNISQEQRCDILIRRKRSWRK